MAWTAWLERERNYRILVALVILLGMLLRLRQYLLCQSVWTDEAHLLVNLANASPGRVVTGPLDYVPRLVGHPHATQAGPPLALLTIKAFITAWPRSELAARFLPFMASVIALPLFAVVARRLLTPPFALAAVALLALAEPVILQAANAKQYSSDALAAVLMLFLATMPRPAEPLRRLLVCALAATVLVWFSHPSVFVYAAASVALGYEAMQRARRGRTLLAWLAINVSPGLSFVALYWFSVRTQTDEFLRNYWAEGFADYSRPLAIPGWLATQFIEAGSYPPVAFTWVLPILILVAVFLAWRGGSASARFAVLLAAAPLMFVVLAAFMRQYPLVGKRLCFFLLPCAMLSAALGADLLAARLSGVWSRAVGLALGVVIAGTAFSGGRITLKPPSQGDVRATVRYVMQRRAPGEPVYIWGGKASSVFYFYVPDPDENIHLTADYTQPPQGDSFWIIAQLGRWGTTSRDEHFEEKLEEMKRELTLTDSLRAHRAGAYRFTRRPATASVRTGAR
jgi:hypothetical protein